MRLDRSVVVLIGGVAALLALGVVVAVLTARRPDVTFPSGSPQETVATYLRLLQEGRVDDAYALTAFPASDPYPMTRERFHEQLDHWSATPHRVTLARTTVQGDRATVVVQIAGFRPGLFGGGDSAQQVDVTLVRTSAGWRVTGPPYLGP